MDLATCKERLRREVDARVASLLETSHEIHAPHGMSPPAQFIIVPLRLVHASSTSPIGVTRIEVVPPRP